MMNLPASIRVLDDVEFFNGIGEAEKRDILAHATTEAAEEEEYLFFQGDLADRMYVVLSGRIRLLQTTPDGQIVIHQHPGQGEAFGIIAVLRSTDFPVSAQAVEPSRLLRWEKEAVTRLILSHPQLALTPSTSWPDSSLISKSAYSGSHAIRLKAASRTPCCAWQIRQGNLRMRAQSSL